MTTRAKVWLAVPCVAIAIACYYPFSPGGVQAANMRKADEQATRLRPILLADARFAGIELSSMTAHEGCLLVSGEVEARDDLDALKATIAASHPPVFVMSVVTVADGPSTHP